MIYKFTDLDYVENRVLEIEKKVTSIHTKGDDLIPPTKGDYQTLWDFWRELQDITKGKNTLALDHAGRLSPSCIFEADEKSLALYWSDQLDNATDYSTGWYGNLPCFIRNGKIRKHFAIDKYFMVRKDEVNHAVGLYGMSPAHSSGGFSVSVNGITSELETNINGGEFPDWMPSFLGDYVTNKHLVTWDERGFLNLLSKEYAFECDGNTNFGRDTSGRAGVMADYLYESQLRSCQTLTGSGPRQWRHDGTFLGIADIVGNNMSWTAGLKIYEGKIYLIDFTSQDVVSASDLQQNGTLWRLISTTDGTFLEESQATDGTYYVYDLDSECTENNGSKHFVSDTVTYKTVSDYNTSCLASEVELKSGLRVEPKFQMIGILPFTDGALGGRQYLRTQEGNTYVLRQGGYWWNSSTAGLGYINGGSYFGATVYSTGGLLASDSPLV